MFPRTGQEGAAFRNSVSKTPETRVGKDLKKGDRILKSSLGARRNVFIRGRVEFSPKGRKPLLEFLQLPAAA